MPKRGTVLVQNSVLCFVQKNRSDAYKDMNAYELATNETRKKKRAWGASKKVLSALIDSSTLGTCTGRNCRAQVARLDGEFRK